MTRIIQNGVHVGPMPRHRQLQAEARAERKAAAPAGVEVSVNGRVIDRAEIEAEAQNHPAENPGAALAAAAQALAVRELLLQEAARLQVEPQPVRVEDGRYETPDDAAIRQLLEQEVVVPEADDDACRRYYDNNRRRFVSPTLYAARHILFAAPAEDTTARAVAAERAESLLAVLAEHPERFGVLAAEWSACPSKEVAGNLGQIGPGQTVAEFEAALAEMLPGSIRPTPLSTRFGLHIIALDRREDGVQLPFEAARDRIAGYLEASSWSRAVAQYLALLAGAADIQGVRLQGADSPLVQ